MLDKRLPYKDRFSHSTNEMSTNNSDLSEELLKKVLQVIPSDRIRKLQTIAIDSSTLRNLIDGSKILRYSERDGQSMDTGRGNVASSEIQHPLNNLLH